MEEAIFKTATRHGVLFTVPAMNYRTLASNYSPARMKAPNVYTVSSIKKGGIHNFWSNYGDAVGLAAPGENIDATNYFWGGGRTVLPGGTSFAAAYAAGVLAVTGNKFNTVGNVQQDPNWPWPIEEFTDIPMISY